jgi:hypothetical protein
VCEVNGGGKESRGGRCCRGKKGEGGRDRQVDTTEVDVNQGERTRMWSSGDDEPVDGENVNENDFDRGRLD